MAELNIKPRTIFCRDNIDILRGINSGCIDLIYLDPPFNKNKVFTAPIGSSAEGAEFSDIFREEDVKDEWVDSIRFENRELYEYLGGVKSFSNRYNYCYLVYMAIRLMECRRVLKEAGSIYLHCDQTMSHHLKVVMDCIFGEKNFRNEIVWCYHGPGSPKMRQFNRKTDTIFWYSRGDVWTFNADIVREPYKDPHQTLRSAMSPDGSWTEAEAAEYRAKGKIPENWWEIRIAARSKKEYVGYPTQKPLALLERIIKASSNEGDVVLDPFCGCATTCIAAESLSRRWIGVDTSVKAYELVQKRLKSVEKKLSNGADHDNGAPPEATFTTTPPKRTDLDTAHAEQGYVYVIANENWKDIYKVGIAKDVERRLNSYQTSDPFRAYKLAYKIKTPHFREVERHIHAKFNGDHEWVSGDLEAIKREIDAAAKAADK